MMGTTASAAGAIAEVQIWYHAIYDTDTAGDTLKLYVDGELAAEDPGGAGVTELWDERGIGSEHDGRFLNGMMGEVHIYDRVLSYNEVARNFAVISNSPAAVEPSSKRSTTFGNIKL